MESATDSDARRRVWTAFQGRAGLPNLELMDRALQLRSELKLAGKPLPVLHTVELLDAAMQGVAADSLRERQT